MKNMTADQAQRILEYMGRIDHALISIQNLAPAMEALTVDARTNNARARDILLSVALADIGVETVAP